MHLWFWVISVSLLTLLFNFRAAGVAHSLVRAYSTKHAYSIYILYASCWAVKFWLWMLSIWMWSKSPVFNDVPPFDILLRRKQKQKIKEEKTSSNLWHGTRTIGQRQKVREKKKLSNYQQTHTKKSNYIYNKIINIYFNIYIYSL